MNTKKTVCWLIGITAVTVIGFLVIPPIIKKYGNRIYKSSLKNDDIDFENMGPDILKKKTEEE